MRRPTKGFLFGLLALTASGGLLMAGCGNTESQVGAVHPVTGAPCASPGVRAPAGDGCNECSCEGGAWQCTEKSCGPSCKAGSMRAAEDGCNTCTCTTDGNWACTDRACTSTCTEPLPPVGDNWCGTCECVGQGWVCTQGGLCTAECTPGEVRLDDQRPGGQCRVCTCLAEARWSCEMTACACSGPDETITADDGCNVCSCVGNSFDDTFHWGGCTEEGCNDRCPLPQYQVQCDANPVYAKNGPDGPCCRYECPSDAPEGWAQFASLAECSGCPVGQVRCGGECVDVQTSVTHCGACQLTCEAQNAEPACIAGVCAIASCAASFADCNADSQDGCEVDARSDQNNCGGCGLVCALANATSSCGDGQCRIEACDLGFADCDADSANGCEVNLSLSVTHCGACGSLCSNPHGTTACSDGECSPTCADGYADCDSDPTNGCESPIAECPM